eukprot:gene10016-7903_t
MATEDLDPGDVAISLPSSLLISYKTAKESDLVRPVSVCCLRGLMATEDLDPGDVAISLPSSLLISYKTAKESDLGAVLQRLPGLGEEAIALIWTMVERREPESPFAAYWASLPDHFGTGLSVAGSPYPDISAPGEDQPSRDPLARLSGTAAHKEALAARKHLLDQFQALSPFFETLCRAYPSFIKPELFEWQAYLWAVELWYAYAIQVQFPGGDVRPCLTPYIGLMNHSPWPHIVHFSKVDPETDNLSKVDPETDNLSKVDPETDNLSKVDPETDNLSKVDPETDNLSKVDPETDNLSKVDLETDNLSRKYWYQNANEQTDIRNSIMECANLSLECRLRLSGPLPHTLRAVLRLLAANKKELLILKKNKATAATELLRPLSPGTEEAAQQMLREALKALELGLQRAPSTSSLQAQDHSSSKDYFSHCVEEYLGSQLKILKRALELCDECMASTPAVSKG